MKIVLLFLVVLLIIGYTSAELIQVNVSEKQLFITGDNPNFYGIVKSNASAYYVTESSTSLFKTLETLNSIPISVNESGTWTLASINVNGGIIE